MEKVNVDEFDNLEIEGKTFRVQNQRLLLTYKTHVDKPKLKEYFLAKWKVKEIHIAHENGDESCPYEHSHVFVDFGKIFQSVNCRIFDWDKIHPHIKKVKTAKHVNHVFAYLAKEDPECAYCLDLVKEGFCIQTIWEADNVQDALRTASRPSDVMGLKMAYDLRPKEEILDSWDDYNFREWQELLASLIKDKDKRKGNDFREVWWVYDPIGDTGKTFFAKACMNILGGKDCLYLRQFGGQRDCATILKNAVETDGLGTEGDPVILFDLPRAAVDHKIYSAIEDLIDGVTTSIKYQGGTVKFGTKFGAPLVIGFSNWLPDVRAMSGDRWKVIEVKKDGGYRILKTEKVEELIRQEMENGIEWLPTMGSYHNGTR